ncbi:MAG: hypothetical protein ABIE03_00890 [Patescibacteria group bacterium]|nr:hypothetical protein [Patescibacteria group bacterium]
MQETEAQETSICIAQYRSFIQRFWGHSLLTPITEQARLEAVSQFNQYLAHLGLADRGILGLPGGSLYSIVGPNSDFDIQVLTWTQTDADIFNTNAGKTYGNMNFNGGAYPAKTDTLIHRVAALLLTPDQFIGGNTAIAREIRYGLMVRMPLSEEAYYWNTFYHYFYQHFLSWRKNRGEIIEGRTVLNSNKRAERFWQTMMLLMKQAPCPAAFVERVYMELETLRPPDMRTIKTALLATQGALEVCI